MTTQDLKIPVPKSRRYVRARLRHSNNPFPKLEQLVIIATGLHSHMDKESQLKLSDTYRRSGFATLQFNFAGHGVDQNKSDGTIKDVTLSSSIQDLKAIWDYSQAHLPLSIDTEHTVISANSYGALISLLALEKNIISPETMVLTAPFSLDKFKKWHIPLSILAKVMPHKIHQILKLPIASEMIVDFLKNHKNAMRKKDLLGSTAVHFFVGSDDNISSVESIKNWSTQFNANSPKETPFVHDLQAHYKIYPNVKHFEIPDLVAQDICDRSVRFIKQVRQLRED